MERFYYDFDETILKIFKIMIHVLGDLSKWVRHTPLSLYRDLTRFKNKKQMIHNKSVT